MKRLSQVVAAVAVAAAASLSVAGGASSATVQHLEYAVNDGTVHVYSIDESFKEVESFTIPETSKGVRGLAVVPSTHQMFVTYGGDGGGYGTGSTLDFDLVSKTVKWHVALSTGIDSLAASNDGTKLYVPNGELDTADCHQTVLNASTGATIETLTPPGNGPHDDVMSSDGKTLLLGCRNYPYVAVYHTETKSYTTQVGPLVGGVRPLTINSKDNRVFTTATGFTGFQVSSTEGNAGVLYTENFGATCGFSTCSHGISLSPDDKEVAVVDAAHKAVQFWDVHGAAESIAPTFVASVPVNGLEGSEQGCAYDCARDGWVQHSFDGRFVFVGDSGAVIETATHKVVANLTNLLNTRKSIEIDFSEGVPVATTNRTGVGRPGGGPPPPPPVNSTIPTISGTTVEGQTLTEHAGTWTNNPTVFALQWLQCNNLGEACLPISGATKQTYALVAGDVGHTIEVEEIASNAGGSSSPVTSGATATVVPPPPINTAPPTITGTAQQGQTLTEHNGSWTNGPTSYSYQWLQCDSLGNGCLPIFGAASQAYLPVEADVGHTIEVQETASYAGGSSTWATSAATAVVLPLPPVNTAPPTITGTAQQGQTLTEHNGSWTNEPTGFAYQWQRCDTAGANCSPVSEATAQTYTVGSADVGSTVRVAVTASNVAGASAPASSAPTAVVQQSSATFGKISVGVFPGSYPSNRKQVNRYALPTAGSVTKLSIYLAPTSTSGQQMLKGLIYADSGSAPGTLLGVSQQLIFTSASSIGWHELVFFSPLKLAAGKYWIGVITGAKAGVAGFRYDRVAGSRDSDTNTYASGPSNPFGSVSTDGRQVSLYATYTAG